ncbi:hypothetical protein [Bradyrhizobium sp. SEMIA]|uniref:hypothetical protein n=1 Tax=Bradyrhizobium sp. SEMIA TaxID=2597515 RepID=UPI0018A5D7B0|nr:hypothetical protein [Bradyrhizobium sp. SEMIA]QOG23384.1 hypothetical protein FOM02_45235 [Bradyrhizobium sp. SEMIA]
MITEASSGSMLPEPASGPTSTGNAELASVCSYVQSNGTDRRRLCKGEGPAGFIRPSLTPPLLAGQYDQVLRVVAFNPVEGWRDVSEDVARDGDHYRRLPLKLRSHTSRGCWRAAP